MWPWVLLGVFVLIAALFVGCFALVGNEISKIDDKRTTAEPAGTEVRDGKFAFLVTGVDPPVTSVGDSEFLKQDAQGEFILVRVDVSNIGNAPQSYFAENQKLIDDQGRSFTNDTAAELVVNPQLTTEINPGNKVGVIVVFDVPKGTTPASIEFHDSMFSGGARVALR
ncbi:DUF4352 domain-containing protein [Nocardia brasiliensis]|uniref:DUF4352 domain-containing protein n=1 Tax=Nocardia brasiliensis TaxID=37326 RepID=A0A6G9Y301_NOCBR|nr:DUF4352 domain-containing protein [Nocardia brasiliensis]